jgi:hypothetical protein
MDEDADMHHAYVLTGSMSDERTVRLDEALPIKEGKVRVVVELVSGEKKPTLSEVLETIHRGQRERGFVSPTREQVDAYLKAERESWDDE